MIWRNYNGDAYVREGDYGCAMQKEVLYMNAEELIILAKMIAYAMGDSSVKLTDLEKEMAFSMLKRNADRRIDWTEQQKEQYKELVDICKRSCDNNS